MKCNICGKEHTLVYASIFLQNGCCQDCYKQAQLIKDWGHRVFDMSIPKDGNGYHFIYKNAFGETLIDKPYKYRKNALKAIVRKTSDIMGTYIF